MKRLSQAEYHLPREICESPCLEQTKISLWWAHIDLFLQVNSQESLAYVHLMDLEIVLGSDCKCKPNMAQASSRCIRSLVVYAFDLVMSSTD